MTMKIQGMESINSATKILMNLDEPITCISLARQLNVSKQRVVQILKKENMTIWEYRKQINAPQYKRETQSKYTKIINVFKYLHTEDYTKEELIEVSAVYMNQRLTPTALDNLLYTNNLPYKKICKTPKSKYLLKLNQINIANMTLNEIAKEINHNSGNPNLYNLLKKFDKKYKKER